MNSRHILLVIAALAACSPALTAADNLFTDDLSTWALKNPPSVSASAHVVSEEGEDALNVEIRGVEENSGVVADVRISQVFGDINAGQTYQINFRVKSEQPGKIVVFISPAHDSQKVLFRREVTVDPAWKDYKIIFPATETTSQCVLGFAGLGRTDNSYFFRPLTSED